MNLVPDDIFQNMVKVRRQIHRYPELAYNEFKTAVLICEELEKLGLEIKGGIGGTGIIATLGSFKSKGPLIALRADMDAIAIQEETGLDFASHVPGIMHACGHDGHVAMLLGAASLLKRANHKGRVIFIFQPAEEGGAGSKKMLQSPLLNKADAIFGSHLDRHFEVGKVVTQEGPLSAYTDKFEITIRGKGGHAAQPHDTVDAIVVASMIVMALQTIVSRESNPAHPLIVSVGRIEGGSIHNAIAEHASLLGTIRSTEPSTREKVIDGIKRIATATADLHNAEVKVEISAGYPPVSNTKKETAMARKAVHRLLGEKATIDSGYVNMGGEDFSFYQEKIPGCFIRIGARKESLGNVPAHSPHFDFDERALAVGAAFMAEVARVALEEMG